MAAKKPKRKPCAPRRVKKAAVSAAPPSPTPWPPSATETPAKAAGTPEVQTEGDTARYIRTESDRHDGDMAIKLYLREIGQW